MAASLVALGPMVAALVASVPTEAALVASGPLEAALVALGPMKATLMVKESALVASNLVPLDLLPRDPKLGQVPLSLE